MLRKMFKYQLVLSCLILILMVLFNGCTSKKYGVDKTVPPIEAKKIVFLGFKPALSPGKAPALFTNPLSGAIVRSEPVTKSEADSMSDQLYTLLADSKDYDFVNLHEIKNLTDPALYEKSSNDGFKIIQSIGKAVSADVAITGYIYRMHKREGTEYMVVSPASVAFDVYIVRVKDGSFLWKGSFDKTQKSLSENLLDFKSFLKFNGKWVDVDKLAEIGLEKLVAEMPLKNK